MDLDGDGKTDILSGSYSRQDSDMAGLFQVLWGKGKGRFKKAEILKGTDGEPLIIPADKKHVTEKICTRPTAVDLDGDGKLDIVSGNFSGSFAFFKGEGKGRFQPQPEWLTRDGQRLEVDAHSDPFFVDWDGDGDQDMLSGSSRGGVYLFVNQGTVKKPAFGPRQTLVEPAGYPSGTRFGDDFLKGPQSGTRVFAADVNGDGALDLLVGDDVTLNYPAKGLDEKTTLKRLEEWNAEQQKLLKSNRAGDAAASKAFNEAYQALWKKRAEFLREDATGFVWVLYRKGSPGGR